MVDTNPKEKHDEAQEPELNFRALIMKFIVGVVVMMGALGLLGLFWVYMFIDLLRHPMARYKKILWVLAFLLANIVGSVLYYFIGRK